MVLCAGVGNICIACVTISMQLLSNLVKKQSVFASLCVELQRKLATSQRYISIWCNLFLLCDMFELLNAMTTKLCLEAVVFRKLMSFDVREACDFIAIYSNLVRFDVADAMCFGFSMR